jgi:hypothetical protein
MYMKFLPVTVILISACTTSQSTDPSKLSFKIPKGSTLTLNKALEIPDNKTHATLQFGKAVTDRERKDYNLNCRFDVKKFGPRTLEPEEFRIRRSEDGQEWISQAAGIIRYYSDVYLDSDKDTDVIKLTCQEQGSKIDRTFTVSDMEKALGDYFTFSFPKPATARPGY